MRSSENPRVVAPTVVSGGLSASAAGGALIAMGRRLGNVWLGFAAIGATLAHKTISSEATGLVLLGVVIHVLTSFVWAIVLVSLVTLGWKPWAAGVVIGCAEFALSWAIATATGSGLASVLAFGDRLVLVVVSAASLVVGLKLAIARPRNASI